MNLKHIITVLALAATATVYAAEEKLIFLDEGLYQGDNGRVSYFEDDHIVSNEWFRENNGKSLGDTPNAIIAVNDNLIAISVNGSNIVQYIDAKGHAVAATDYIPGNRKFATDGTYLYISSYGHECETVDGKKTFTKGICAKVDIANDYKIVAATEVGWEPEGIAYYRGHLFVANSGGYSFNEDHDYEHTVSVLDAVTMQVVRTVDVRQLNLYGNVTLAGRYLCISSPGDYYQVPAATIILDCEAVIGGKPDEECFVKIDKPATYNTLGRDGKIYTLGTTFSYDTMTNTVDCMIIDPTEAFISKGASGISTTFPGTIQSDVEGMTAPYGLYVNPYTGYFYGTDAGNYTSAGTLYQWDNAGALKGTYRTYINPSHFLALRPDSQGGVSNVTVATPADDTVYNLYGLPVSNPVAGQIYIRGGKKIIWQK